jgi:hypothetical protein
MSSRRADRPLIGLRRSFWRYPLIQAGGAVAVASAASASVASLGVATIPGIAAFAIAATFGLAAVLILMRSVAIQQIYYFQDRTKLLRSSLARVELYGAELDDALRAVREFRGGRGGADPHLLVERILKTAAVRCSAALGPSVRIYIVRTTSVHLVRWAAGDEGFHRAGDECAADRSLEEIARRFGTDYHIVPLTIEGSPHSMVLVADGLLTDAERALARRIAMLLELAVGQLRSPTARDQARSLRAV